MSGGEVLISFRGVRKRFGAQQVLDGVDLDVRRGETLVIIGRSGCGKSVLLKHMIGLIRPDEGQILLEGRDITGLPEGDMAEVRGRFGMVFQGAALFDSMSVGENVAFPLREHRRLKDREIKRIVAAKLQLVDLEGVEHLFPSELSGGMRKRVGLARAIVLDPKIILYDEPTTGLDPITANSVDEMIMSAKTRLGVTSVVITHDIASSFRIGDWIAMIHEGVIVEQGPPKALRESAHPFVHKFLQTWFDKGD